MGSKYILHLNARTASLDLVGGKGASLTRLINAGFNVPDGYHITTMAYQRFVDENSLQPRILEILDRIDTADPESVSAASQEITAMFNGAEIPVSLVVSDVLP